jgi:hypothetical protein
VGTTTALEKILNTLELIVEELGASDSQSSQVTRTLNAELMPVLVVLTRAVRCNPKVLRCAKARVFPLEADAVWQQRLVSLKASEEVLVAAESEQLAQEAAERAACSGGGSGGVAPDNDGGALVVASTTATATEQEEDSELSPLGAQVAAAREARARQRQEAAMHPVDSDAPPGSLRHGICRLITSLDSQVKRCVSEFLLALCGGDLDEFTLRCGYGNAAYMHHILGSLQGLKI